MKTIGHCAGNGGLRGHSVGELFPYIFVVKGKPTEQTYWLRYPNNFELPLCNQSDGCTIHDAYKIAEYCKEFVDSVCCQ